MASSYIQCTALGSALNWSRLPTLILIVYKAHYARIWFHGFFKALGNDCSSVIVIEMDFAYCTMASPINGDVMQF